MPKLEIQKRYGLTNAIEYNFNNPQNSHDRVTAVHLAIITNVWSKQEARDKLEQVEKRLEFGVRESRFLREMGIMPLDK